MERTFILDIDCKRITDSLEVLGSGIDHRYVADQEIGTSLWGIQRPCRNLFSDLLYPKR